MYLESGEPAFRSEITNPDRRSKQQFPVSQGTRTGLNRGILLGCGYAENGGVYLLGCEPGLFARILADLNWTQAMKYFRRILEI